MSSTKLDIALDDIVKTNKTRRPNVRGRRVPNKAKTVTPAGGVSKKTRAAKTTKAAVTAAQAVTKNKAAVPVPAKGESKIVVTGLPADVTEQQIKDYFAKTIGPVKRAMLTYGPNGQSRGVATVVFNKPSSAVEAATNLNGVKIEVIVGANQAPVPVPAKGLGDRITQPKNQPKKAETKAATKAAVKSAAKTAKPATKKAKGAKTRAPGRGKKTAEELDAEMTDYFGDGTTNGAGQENTAMNGGMEDEIM